MGRQAGVPRVPPCTTGRAGGAAGGRGAEASLRGGGDMGVCATTVRARARGAL